MLEFHVLEYIVIQDLNYKVIYFLIGIHCIVCWMNLFLNNLEILEYIVELNLIYVHYHMLYIYCFDCMKYNVDFVFYSLWYILDWEDIFDLYILLLLCFYLKMWCFLYDVYIHCFHHIVYIHIHYMLNILFLFLFNYLYYLLLILIHSLI